MKQGITKEQAIQAFEEGKEFCLFTKFGRLRSINIQIKSKEVLLAYINNGSILGIKPNEKT